MTPLTAVAFATENLTLSVYGELERLRTLSTKAIRIVLLASKYRLDTFFSHKDIPLGTLLASIIDRLDTAIC